MATEAVAAATTAAVANTLFNYNRDNFLFDSENRYDRFVSGREFACQQMEQYRGDIRTLTSLTVKKNNMYAMIATLDMALCICIYGAGRLGLRGQEPPGWVLALFLTNNAASFCFQAIAIFLALHASFRCHACSISLLTRKARVPVPTMKQLDKARRFASEFEQQSWGDIFRVPYISNNGAPKTDLVSETSRAKSVPAHVARRARNKASSWIRDEFETDRAGTVMGPSNGVGPLPENAPPEHFRLYAQMQKEWFQYEVYARIAVMYGYRCLIHSLAIYAIIHIVVELRAFWAAWTTAFIFEVLHFFILRFDIVAGHNRQRQNRLPYCQYFGHLTTLFTGIAMALDFRVEFNLMAIGITWLFVFLAYISEVIYQLRMLELVLPDDLRAPLQTEDRIGSAWWPERWQMPSVFSHVIYFVAPPEQLQPGQHDLVREVKEGCGMEVWEQIVAGGTGLASLPQGGSKEDLITQVRYLEGLFEWAFSNQVFESMSPAGKGRVRELYHNFAQTRSAGPDSPKLPQVIQDTVTGLETVVAEEGLPGIGKSQDSGSDYDSPASGYSSGAASDVDKLAGMAAAATKVIKNPYPSPASQGPEPWRLVSLMQLVFSLTWVFLVCTVVIDCTLGDQALVTHPSWSRPPMTRMSNAMHSLGTPYGGGYPADSRPLIPEQLAWTEEHRKPGTLINGPSVGSPNRRLSEGKKARMGPARLKAAVKNLLNAVPGIEDIGSEKLVPQKLPVSWPVFFEPKLLACGPNGAVAAITPRGFGAVAKSEGGDATSFRLGGLGQLLPLVAATWGAIQSGENAEGLMLVTRHGRLAICPGQPQESWVCSHVTAAPPLPLADGARLATAAAAWLHAEGSAPQLHAAMVEESSAKLASIFVLDGTGEDASWLPIGDIALPHSAKHVSLSFMNGELLVTTDAGHVIRRRMQDGAVVETASHLLNAPSSDSEASWRAACALTGQPGSVAHLQLRREAGAHAWRPELLTLTKPQPSILQ